MLNIKTMCVKIDKIQCLVYKETKCSCCGFNTNYMILIIQGYRQIPLALGPQYINQKTDSLKLYTLVTFGVLVAVQPQQ